ncbi:MAG: Ig-like domain-containing protein [Kiritimatiellae bacterium]|nr:Ig-like domain-containing protein [Kiritimatiellia bacterium]
MRSDSRQASVRTSNAFCTCILFIVLSALATGIRADIGNTESYRAGDASYHSSAGIVELLGMNHAGLVGYVGSSDDNSGIYEMSGYWPFGDDKCVYRTMTEHKATAETWYGAYTAEGDISTSKRDSIVDTANDICNDPDISYQAGDALTHETNPGTTIEVNEITGLRCDGLVEYCYEKNDVWIWGKTDNGQADGTPQNFDVSRTEWVVEHADLGRDQPWKELSPYVQRGGGYADSPYTKMTGSFPGGPPPSGSTPPAISMTDPSTTYTADEGVNIRWIDADPDSNASISLWEDSNNSGYNGSLLAWGISEDAGGNYGAYYLFTENMPDGKEFYVYAKIDDGHQIVNSDNYTAKIVVDHPSQGSDLSIDATAWTDEHTDTGDRDGIPEGGEDNVEVEIRLENASGSDLTQVEATLSTSAGSVSITDNNNYYGTISGGGQSWGSGDYNMDLNCAYYIGCPFTLDVTYRKDGSPYHQSLAFNKTFPADGQSDLAFEITNVTIDDSFAEHPANNTNGVLESGESVEFDLYLRNVGNADAVEVEAKATDVKGHDSTTFAVYDGWEDYPDLPAGCSAQKQDGSDFQDIEIPKSFTGNITADITVKYGAGEIEQVLQDQVLFNVQPAAWIYVEPDTMNFGTSPTTSNVVKSITIRNAGSASMQVTAISPSHSDTTWNDPASAPLPWTITAGGTKAIDIIITTSNLQGNITRTVVVESSGRVDDAGEDDRIIISGLVSDAVPVFEVLGVGSGDRPDVSGSIVVWDRSGDIFAYDMKKEIEFPICTNEHVQSAPRIDGNIIAWMDRRNWDGQGDVKRDIYAYDLSTSQEFAVVTHSSDEGLLGVDDGKIAFTRHDFTYDKYWNGNPIGEQERGYNIYYYVLASSSTVQVTSYAPSSGNPLFHADLDEGDFSEGVICWEREEHSWQDGGWNDGFYPWAAKFSIGTDGSPVNFANRTQNSAGPGAGGGRIAWVDDYGLSNYQLFMWTSGSGVQQLTTGDDEYENAAVGADYIVCRKNPDGPVSYQFIYRDVQTGAEALIQESADVDEWRVDGNTVVWFQYGTVSNRFRYAFLGADLLIGPDDIAVTPSSPCDTDSLCITVTVHNISDISCGRDVTVKLYDGDPDEGGTQVGSDQTIAGGIVADGSSAVTFGSITLPEGERDLYAECSIPVMDNPFNNKASKSLLVQDSDIYPPTISNVQFTAVGGDGDGYVEEDEAVRISWSLSDATGIGWTYCVLDGQSNAPSGSYYVDVGVLAAGIHTVRIEAADSDLSPEQMNPWTDTFEVYSAGPSITALSPTNGTLDATRDCSIHASFNDFLDADSVTNGTVLVSNGGSVVGAVTYNLSSKQVTFEPSTLLEFNTTYTVTVLGGGSGVTDMIGNNLESNHVWSFTTVADTEDPTASITEPLSGGYAAGNMKVRGTAHDEGLSHYILEAGAGASPSVWTPICTVSNVVSFGALGTWDTTSLGDEVLYSLRLRVFDKAGHVSTNIAASILVLDATTDHDGDGVNSGDEIIAGVCPTNINDFFKIEDCRGPGGTNFALSWNSVVGRQYRVYASTNLMSTSSWSQAAIKFGDGTNVEVSVDSSPEHQYFKIEVEEQ